MNDKVITLENGKEYFVVDTIVHNKNIYILCTEVDTKSEDVVGNLITCKVMCELSNMTIERIEDKEERVHVTELFMKRINKDL